MKEIAKKLENIPLETKLKNIREIMGGVVIFKLGIKDKDVDLISATRQFDEDTITELEEPQEYIG